MFIKRRADIRSSEITPKRIYLERRRFIASLGAAGVSLASATRVSGLLLPQSSARDGKGLNFRRIDIGNPNEQLTPLKDIAGFVNFYEFGVDKEDPPRNAEAFKTRPWTVSIEGLVKKPALYDVDDILKMHSSLEERIYRFRCVEGWSMVIPWIGIPLSSVIKTVEPSSKARFVAFQTLFDPARMPGQRLPLLRWPYIEGLRIDEAMHPLTLLAAGLYGETLPNQNGAPLRLVVPWKYGFKSIKSIVKIRLVEKQPPTSWSTAAPAEYGFYANVNPRIDHPRWGQAKEQRVGELFKRDTLAFNGYGADVAQLYSGMDLGKYY
jgi:methionine sulfoxide reductase catalytic subunit